MDAVSTTCDAPVSGCLSLLSPDCPTGAMTQEMPTHPAEAPVESLRTSGTSDDHPGPAIKERAACLRANRKLRSSIESALAAEPPERVAQRLELLRDQTDRDAADLNVRLRELVTLPVSSAGVSHLGDSVAPRAAESSPDTR